MNDKNFIRTKVRKSLRKLFNRPYLSSYELHRLNVLSAMVSSILISGRTELSKMALCNPERTKLSSRVKQFKRLLMNEHVDTKTYYLPYIQPLLENLAVSGELVFSIDGSVVGNGCMCLMFSVIYKGKAIPVVWKVYRRKKGHLPEKEHQKLLGELADLVPKTCRVIIAGDGEFDGCSWQSDILELGWDYVLRTGKNVQITEEQGDTFKAGFVKLNAGEQLFFEEVGFTQKGFETNLFIWHGKGHKAPLILITNLDFGMEIKRFYKKRFKIEPFFRDMKSQGFHINRSGLREPERLHRLLLAACLAYILCVMGGSKASKSDFYNEIARTDGKWLSLFQLGRRFLLFLVDIRQWRSFSIIRDLKHESPFIYNCVPF